MDELAGNTWGAILALSVQHVKLNFGNRLADRSRPGAELIGRQPRRPKSFGQSVHEDNVGRGKRFPQVIKHSRRDRSARCAHITQRREIHLTSGTRKLRIKHACDDDRHQWQGGNPLLAQQTKQIARKDQMVQVERRSYTEGLPKLVQPVVEIQREHACNPISGFRPEIARNNPRAIRKVPVGYDDAFGPASRS